LIDNNASALSFDTTGKAGIINIVTTNGSEGVTMSGTLSVTGNANVGNLNTTTAIITTGNITTINSGLLQNGNSNITITSNGNVSIQAAGSNVELVVTSTGANVTGTLSATGNITGGNLSTAGTITANGGSYGEVVTTQFASVYATGAGSNPYAIMQVRSSDGVSGLGMQAFTGTGTLYGNTNIIFALGTIRDKDVPSSLVTKAYIDSTGLNVTGIVSATGNVTGGNLNAAGLSLSGNVVSALNMITAITTTGNITGGNVNATSNVIIAGQLAATIADATALAIALG
jgi:hypothetical protein